MQSTCDDNEHKDGDFEEGESLIQRSVSLSSLVTRKGVHS